MERLVNKSMGSKVFVRTLLTIFASALACLCSSGQVVFDDDIRFDYASPQKYEIGGITVSGVKFLDNNVLIMLSGLSVGDMIEIPGEAVSAAIRNLWEQGLFENVIISATKIEGNTIFLNYELQERPRLSVFSFDGIKKTEADNIRDEIKLTSGDVVTDNLLIRTNNRIKKYYEDKGYLDADVNIVQVEDTSKSNHVRLEIVIKKNKKIKIKNIRVSGADILTSERVRRAMKETKEKGYFKPFDNLEKLLFDFSKNTITLRYKDAVENLRSYLNKNIRLRIFKSSKYIRDSYEEDKVAVIEKYNQYGFRDAKIVSDSVYRNPGGEINIDLRIKEGNRYYFRNITWVGNTKYTSGFLTAKLRIEKGDLYNWELLNSNLNFNQNEDDISSLYMNDGYLFFSAQPVEVMVENDSIDLEIRIYEGKQATIDRVSLKGNTRTNDHVVIRELYTRPGQLFSRSDIIRTTRELAQLMYFNPEKITPQVDPNPAEGTVNVGYEVEETSSDQVELSGGWGYGRVIGTLGVSFNNFSARKILKKGAWRPVPIGDGQKLSLRLQSYGKGYYSYSASFTEPWLGGKKPNSFSVSYYHSLYSNGLSRKDANRQSFSINGLSFGLGKRLTWPDDFFQLYQSINLQTYELKNYSRIFAFGSGTGNYNNFNYEIVLSRHSIDQRIYPRLGSIVSLGLAVTPPYSWFSDTNYEIMTENDRYKWIEYHKWDFHVSWFTRLAGNLVLMPRLKYGFLGYLNPDIGVTPFERYYLGGDGLSGYNNLDGREIIGMRGYGNETLTPDYYRSSNTGGTIYSKYTLELRYPLSLNPSATIYVMSFLEAGNAWNKFAEFEPFNVYRSAGFGVRVFLPMFGILGLDWGYGFDQVPGIPDANKGQFHFSINQSID
ncbi:MAG: BamA/TamA family outer membrane protein [Bacteroidales bacterium]|nr:BamA/TamA family outer membrane protein [Bacteroidales bacterium]